MRESRKDISFLLVVICVALIAFILWGNNAYAQSDLKIKEPEVCYQCHKELKDSLSHKYTHFLFKQGKCNTCHNPHVSNIEGLIRGEINSLCLSCHKDIRDLLKKANVHTALKRGVCTDCHYGHSGENKHLIVKAKNKLCWDCHENLKEQLKESYTHPFFKKGECLSCHSSHASSEDDLLRTAPNKTCKKCHAPRCKAGEVSISSATKKSDCTTCHTGHSSKYKGLLGPYGHTAFLNKSCEQCHNPIVANRRITTKAEGKNLCFSCHKKETPTKYIDDDIHVKDAKNPCTICHDYHASGKKNLTKKESGLCLTCHEDTEKRTTRMEKALKSIKCAPIKDRKCFECHMRQCSSEQPLYFTGDTTLMCAKCHETQHKITHPLGAGVIDPRNGQIVTCLSCHSMHSARAEFILTHDRKRALCIQCHKK